MSLTRRSFLTMAPALALAGCNSANMDVQSALGATKDLVSAASLTDAQVAAYGKQMSALSDRRHTIAPTGNKYAVRLSKITQGMQSEEGLQLNFKVYLLNQVNATASPDGSIRFYSALMDILSDDEIRFVVGHEIGHVKAGHTRKRMQTAMLTSAAKKSAAASGNGAIATLADSDLGDLIESVVRAQHSQSNEREADDYAMEFMSRKKYDRKAGPSLMDKFAKLEGKGGGPNWLSTHPTSKERGDRLRAQAKA